MIDLRYFSPLAYPFETRGRNVTACPASISCYVGFEVLTAVNTKMAVFWVVAASTRLHGATTPKTAIFICCYHSNVFSVTGILSA
jgi:hypothetical protein